MITTPEAALVEIERLGLPPIFTAIMTGAVPAYLRYLVQCPHNFFRIAEGLQEAIPELTGLCPLWEENGDTIVGRLPDGTFVRHHYEDSRSLDVLGANYSQFVTTLLMEMYEADVWEQCGAPLAADCRYRRLEELLAILDSWVDEDDEVRLERFRESLTDTDASSR